jgi:hypothetical protein
MELYEMNTRPTPGPWQYVFEGGTTAFITEADGSTIICIRTTENTTAHKDLAANVQLIAAAPTMLEALQRIAGLLNSTNDNVPDIRAIVADTLGAMK